MNTHVLMLYDAVLDLKYKLENKDLVPLDEIDLKIIPKLAAQLTDEATSIRVELKNYDVDESTIEITEWIIREASEIRASVENLKKNFTKTAELSMHINRTK